MKRSLVLIALALLVATAPLFLRDFYVSLLNMIGIYVLVVLGLTMLVGWTGLISFGHAAFFGVGAYATAWFTTAQGGSPVAGLLLGVAVTGGIAVVLGAISLRLSGHYLSLATLAWGMGLYLLFGNLHMLGRQNGISGIPHIAILDMRLDSVRELYWLIWAFVGLAMLATFNLAWSRQGRGARLLKGGVILGECFGVNSFTVRLTVFVIGAVFASVAGWLYAHTFRFVSPAPFGLMNSVEFLLMAVLGGTSSAIGALLGTNAMVFLRDLVQDILPLFSSYGATLEGIAFGIIFVLLLQHASGGLTDYLPELRRSIKVVGRPALPKRALPERGAEVLRVEGLEKRFGGLLAVDKVDFTVRASEIVGLIGPNGAGKSTTFNLVSGLLEPTAGKVMLLGRDVTALQPRDLFRQGVARTFQHVRLNPTMSVLENTLIGLYGRTRSGFMKGALKLDRREERQAVEEAMFHLRRVGLDDKAMEPAGSLSLGQQRVLEVARALAADPILLMLDEPAAGLRHHEKVALAQLLSELRSEGVSVMLVEHDMGFMLGLADRIVVLNFGTRLAEGRPGEIRTNPAVIEAYLGADE